MQIAVVGCGWLGLPLAISLQTSGYNIVPTCRSQLKAHELIKLGFNAVRFELGDKLNQNHLAELFRSKILVLNIPVGRNDLPTEHFVKYMQALLEHAAQSQIQKVVFVSTTSVYGSINGICTERSPTPPQTRSGKINLAVEVLVKNIFPASTIIRSAGLVGKDRHPVYHLAGKTGLLNPDNKVNLVHQDDVVCAIQTVIEKNIWGQTLHLSALEHPTRAQYYTWAAKKLGLSPVNFVKNTGLALGKQIDATKSLQLLELSLKYPSPFDMVD